MSSFISPITTAAADVASNLKYCFDSSREMVNADRARELIGKVEVNAPTHLDLSNKSFDEHAAVVIGEDLAARCATVIYANLADMIAGRQEEEALLTLKSICDGLKDNKLIDLDLSDNAMGKPGIIACENVLNNKDMKKLYLCNDGLSGDAAIKLAEIMLEGGAPPLEVFHYHNNMSGIDGAEAIANILKECPQLTDFRFSTTRSLEAGCLFVAKALATMENKFVKLNLSDNSFGGPSLEYTCTCLGKQSALISLDFRDSSLGEDGFNSVVDALLEAKPQLTFLDLSGNDLEADNGKDLNRLLCSLPTLCHLALDDNTIESEGAMEVAKALKETKPCLQTLSMNFCDMTAAGAYDIAKNVAVLPSFELLKMDGNMICERGLQAINSVLLGHKKTLETMEDNDEDGDDDLEDALDEIVDSEEEDEEAMDELLRATAAVEIKDK